MSDTERQCSEEEEVPEESTDQPENPEEEEEDDDDEPEETGGEPDGGEPDGGEPDGEDQTESHSRHKRATGALVTTKLPDRTCVQVNGYNVCRPNKKQHH